MSNSWIQRNPQKLVTQVVQMNTGMQAYQAQIPLTAAQMTAFGTQVTAFSAAVDDWLAAKLAYEAAIEARKTAQIAMTSKARTYGDLVQASVSITNAQRAEIGVPIHDATPSPVIAQTVTDLVATPNAAGFVKLKFNRNGNKPTVQFNIEGKTEGGDWTLIAVSGRVNNTLSGFAPGVPYSFRVIAVSASSQAQPSNVAVIYSEGSGASLTLAA